MYISNRNFIKNAHYINKINISQKIREENEYGRYDILDKYHFIVEFIYMLLSNYKDTIRLVTCDLDEEVYYIIYCDSNRLIAKILFSTEIEVTLSSDYYRDYSIIPYVPNKEYVQFVELFENSINLEDWEQPEVFQYDKVKYKKHRVGLCT